MHIFVRNSLKFQPKLNNQFIFHKNRSIILGFSRTRTRKVSAIRFPTDSILDVNIVNNILSIGKVLQIGLDLIIISYEFLVTLTSRDFPGKRNEKTTNIRTNRRQQYKKKKKKTKVKKLK